MLFMVYSMHYINVNVYLLMIIIKYYLLFIFIFNIYVNVKNIKAHSDLRSRMSLGVFGERPLF